MQAVAWWPGDAAALKEKFAAQGQQQAFGQLSQGEQAAALASANPQVFEELAAVNKAYKARHGFIFIICASGKSAPQMLEAIRSRINHSPYDELGLPISLLRVMDGSAAVFDCLASGVTDADGRIGNLLPASAWVAPGTYRMRFDTGTYLRACRERHPDVFRAVPFYPEATIDFSITPDMASQHFHIPLLLNPYGYSTYRGS
ncbi:hypothetical protein OEZ85_008175 [Tetradesmus obliquus]|uniref:2-oxo-4-hydroxy-4-carboxy-5-ureidoimidazoline decarboxylase n=1 Tax=Tetradesmus obliquus TaxID=3088 RepID=A0ABY8TI41_TETOB|nr:hypothetical protein OEZ85_008175 [Tetradesmus obliquus]